MGSEAVSGRFGGVSGNLRAVGSTRTDDRRSPKGTGGAKGRRGRERRPSSRSDGSSVVLVAREAGDRDADELARDGPVPAVRGGARERFGGVRRAGLSHSKVDKPAYPLGPRFAGPQRGWRGVLRPLRSRRTPALRCGVRARPSCEPCPVAPDGAWPRRLRSRSMARAGAVPVRLRAIVGRRDLVGGVRAAAMTVRWSSGSAPATRFATAAPTARCPGSGAGSWGFMGGATSPWPDRNVSHCVAWLRRIRSSPGTDAWNRRHDGSARPWEGGGQPRRLRSR